RTWSCPAPPPWPSCAPISTLSPSTRRSCWGTLPRGASTPTSTGKRARPCRGDSRPEPLGGAGSYRLLKADRKVGCGRRAEPAGCMVGLRRVPQAGRLWGRRGFTGGRWDVYPAPFEYSAPTTLEEAAALLA